MLILCVFLLLLIAWIFVTQKYTVRTVSVEGNSHYSNEEIKDYIMGGSYGNNSIYLTIKYKNKVIKGLPFVESMDVSILSPDSIKINVYEKALAGYVEYLGRYMYFDKDGIIVETSEEKTPGIPQVTGLQFGYLVLYEKLPVENDTIFKKIMNITQLLTKYEIATDKIYFDSSYAMTLYFGETRVELGTEENLDKKIKRLQSILPSIEGKSGSLRMENYTEGANNVTFKLD